jgi:hypothetical protein
VKLTTHLQLVPRSRKCGSIHPLLCTSSWRNAELVKQLTAIIIGLLHMASFWMQRLASFKVSIEWTSAMRWTSSNKTLIFCLGSSSIRSKCCIVIDIQISLLLHYSNVTIVNYRVFHLPRIRFVFRICMCSTLRHHDDVWRSGVIASHGMRNKISHKVCRAVISNFMHVGQNIKTRRRQQGK